MPAGSGTSMILRGSGGSGREEPAGLVGPDSGQVLVGGVPRSVYPGGVYPGPVHPPTLPYCTLLYPALCTPVGHVLPAPLRCTRSELSGWSFWACTRSRTRSFWCINIPGRRAGPGQNPASQRRIPLPWAPRAWLPCPEWLFLTLRSTARLKTD